MAMACAAFLDSNVSRNPMRTDGLGCDNMTLMLVDLRAGGKVASGRKVALEHADARATTLVLAHRLQRRGLSIWLSLRDKLQRASDCGCSMKCRTAPCPVSSSRCVT